MRVGITLMALVVTVLLAAGCGDSKPAASAPAEQAAGQAVSIVQPGAPGEESKQLTAAEAEAAEKVEHTQVDIDFMMSMIHHHQQALVMAGMVPKRTQSTSLRLLAKRMQISQESEITLVKQWLSDRGEDPNDHRHAHPNMPGMLKTAQLNKLRDARGKAFDRLFLRYMTFHHQGALTMVQELRDDGGGLEAEIDRFAREVDSDQAIEIERMQELLEKL